MVKALFIVALLLLLGACTEEETPVNMEILSLPSEEMPVTNGETTEHVEILTVPPEEVPITDGETTENIEMPIYSVEDTINGYNEYSNEESELLPLYRVKYHFAFPDCSYYGRMFWGRDGDLRDEEGFLVLNNFLYHAEFDRFHEPAAYFPRSELEPTSIDIIVTDDRRIIVTGGSAGWPGTLRDHSYDVDRSVEINVIIRHQFHEGNYVTISSGTNGISQIPGFHEDNFSDRLSVTSTSEQISIFDEERENSRVWEWLMDEENAWRITVNDPRPFSAFFQDISGDLWDSHGIQIFVYGADATIITQEGVLSQFPELQEDNLYFDLHVCGGFEMQYVMLHERGESKLWQMLAELNPKLLEPVVLPCLPRCHGCQLIYLNEEPIQRCRIPLKFRFDFISASLNRDNELEHDGNIIISWRDNEGNGSAMNTDIAIPQRFYIQDERIIPSEHEVQMIYDEYGNLIPSRITINELTTTQWDEWGIQIFEYGGDITLISKRGILSRMPEVLEDNLFVDFNRVFLSGNRYSRSEFETTYLLSHELPESKVWNLLMNS